MYTSILLILISFLHFQLFFDMSFIIFLSILVSSILLSLFFVTLTILYLRYHYTNKRSKRKNIKVGFFHPYCNAGGGGERVLWSSVQALHKSYPSVDIVVYTGDIDASPHVILGRVDERFNIKLPDTIEFIYLHKRYWVEASRYPYFTLAGQSFGSVILGIEALNSCLPDVYIDTMGYAFTAPIFSYVACSKVASYVHYPTITVEMMKKVSSRHTSHNNRRFITRNPFITFLKLIYYKIFAILYKFAGRCCDVVMVNSTWTEEHINSLWNCPLRTHKVYPPCDTTDLQTISLQRTNVDKIKIISIAQFRPEKDHPLQLRTMYHVRQIISEESWEKLELVLIGSTRGEADEMLVQDMKDLCKHLSLENNVSFKINIPYSDLKNELQQGLIGIHTMWNEHFGIGVVECMAAGLIMIAHNSGGPKMDIIEETNTSRNGFLASNEVEYAKVIAAVTVMSERVKNKIQEAARSSVDRFSVKQFQINFLRSVEPLFRT